MKGLKAEIMRDCGQRGEGAVAEGTSLSIWFYVQASIQDRVKAQAELPLWIPIEQEIRHTKGETDG